MSLARPLALLLLLVLPLGAVLYGRWRSHPTGQSILHPDLALLAAASKARRPWTVNWGVLGFALAFAVAAVALARPALPVPVPDDRTTIMLAVDVSLSMRADDIQPTRLEAAKEAAKAFLKTLPARVKVGLVSFAAYPVLEYEPTLDRAAIVSALDGLQLGYGTAIGAGLQLATESLPERAQGDPMLTKFPPAAIVLLSDGRNNRPPFNVLDIAAHTRDLQVRVFTVGLGTNNGFLAQGADGIGGFEVGFDSQTLREIASITGGRFFEANSARQLDSVYQGLGRDVAWTSRPRDVTSVASGLAGLLLLIALLAGSAERRLI